jgi:MFS family permease
MKFLRPRFEPASAVHAAPAAGEPSLPAPRRPRPSALDYTIARACLFLCIIVYTCLSLNVSETSFILLSILVTFGSADSPALNSLALSLLPTAKERGKMFGALSVIQALSASILSPLLFGTLFASTVGWYAPAVFALAAIFLFGAWVFLGCVRLPTDGELAAGDVERGRSRMVKTVRSSSVVQRESLN